MSETKKTAIVILAAGLGTRMKSDLAKVLHLILDKPMISYVVRTAQSVAEDNIVVVVGHQAELVKETVLNEFKAQFAYQEQQLGTGHAVLCAMPYVFSDIDNVLILCGDTPLLTPETLGNIVTHHNQAKNIVTLLAVEMDNPTGYGRILLNEENNMVGIVEQSDASEIQKDIKIVNSGIYCVDKAFLKSALTQIDNDNAQGELYLTDIIKIGYKLDQKMGVIITDKQEELIGVNSRQDLSKAEEFMRTRVGKRS